MQKMGAYNKQETLNNTMLPTHEKQESSRLNNNMLIRPNNIQNVITPNDVLCGRSRFAFDHPGNVRLRESIQIILDQYNTSSRKERTIIIRDIIKSIMKNGGRFLKFNDKKNQWYDGGFEAAKIRVSTAVRDAARSCVKERITTKTKKEPSPLRPGTENDGEPLKAFPLPSAEPLEVFPLPSEMAAPFHSELEKPEAGMVFDHEEGEPRSTEEAATAFPPSMMFPEPTPLDLTRCYSSDSIVSILNASDSDSMTNLLEALDLLDGCNPKH